MELVLDQDQTQSKRMTLDDAAAISDEMVGNELADRYILAMNPANLIPEKEASNSLKNVINLRIAELSAI